MAETMSKCKLPQGCQGIAVRGKNFCAPHQSAADAAQKCICPVNVRRPDENILHPECPKHGRNIVGASKKEEPIVDDDSPHADVDCERCGDPIGLMGELRTPFGPVCYPCFERSRATHVARRVHEKEQEYLELLLQASDVLDKQGEIEDLEQMNKALQQARADLASSVDQGHKDRRRVVELETELKRWKP